MARELTKQFEEFRRGTVRSLAESYQQVPPRGEVVLVIAGGEPVELDVAALRTRAHDLRTSGLSARDIVRVLTEDPRTPRNLAYKLAHE